VNRLGLPVASQLRRWLAAIYHADDVVARKHATLFLTINDKVRGRDSAAAEQEHVIACSAASSIKYRRLVRLRVDLFLVENHSGGRRSPQVYAQISPLPDRQGAWLPP
jgi:hypothetical protein